MIQVFYGDDVVSVRASAHNFIDAVCSEDVILRRVSADQFETGMIPTLAESNTLFGGVECIVLDTLSVHEEAFTEMIDALSRMQESSHTFVIIEQKLLAKHVQELKRYAEEMIECKSPAKDFFNVFSLADALARKDKKSLWILLTRAQHAGLAPEEIVGTLFWQLKALRLARVTKSAAEAGLKDFVYSKAKRASQTFTSEELQKLSHDLVTVYHEGHLGTDMRLALERWVLTI